MSLEANTAEMELALLLEEVLPFPVRARGHAAEAGQAFMDHSYSIPATWGEKRCREFLAGRKAAESALGAWSARPCEIQRDAEGVPVFPYGFSGSITHTGSRRTRAFAAVTEGARPIGLDAEEVRTLGMALHSHIVDDDELRVLGSSPLELDLGVLVAFSAKEAFYKCVYPEHRRFIGFREVSFAYQERQAPHRARVFDCQVQHKTLDMGRVGVVLVGQDLVLSFIWNSDRTSA